MKNIKKNITFIIAILSFLFALASLIISYSSYNISKETHEAEKPFQFPIINIRDSKVNYSIVQTNGTETKMSFELLDYDIIESNEGVIISLNISRNETIFNITINALLIHIEFNLTNEGNGIAENISMYSYVGFFNNNLSNDERIIVLGSKTIFGKFYPDAPISMGATIKVESKENAIEDIISGKEFAFIMRFECNDYVTGKKIVEPIWSKIRFDSNSLFRISNEEKKLLEPYYLEIIS